MKIIRNRMIAISVVLSIVLGLLYLYLFTDSGNGNEVSIVRETLEVAFKIFIPIVIISVSILLGMRIELYNTVNKIKFSIKGKNIKDGLVEKKIDIYIEKGEIEEIIIGRENILRYKKARDIEF